MKAPTLIGILLIVLGLAGFVLGEFTFTHQKKVLDVGPVRVQHEETRTVPISPILSTLALVGGVVLVVAGVKSK